MDNIFQNQHPADIAEHLTALDKKNRTITFYLLSNDSKVEVFSYLDSDIQQEIVSSLTDHDLAEVLNNLSPDDRTELFETFPDALIKHFINLLRPEERNIALNLMGYDERCIARIMTPNYIQVKDYYTISEVLVHIKKFGKRVENLHYVFIVDDNNVLIDDLRIEDILLADDETKVSSLMDSNFVALRTTMSIDDAIEDFEKYDRSAIPIVTEKGVLVGIVTSDDILEEMQERDTEDIQKFGGMEELDVSYTRTPIMELIKKRAGWLVVLFIGEMFTASAMSYYDGELEKAIVLALFVPLIISSGGNSGSQAASLIIRAMALGELKLKDWWYVLVKELKSGLALGTILGLIGFMRIVVWEKAGIYDYGEYWLYVALTVSLSLVVIVLWGTLAGALIPFILRKIGFDPATASSPFVATLVDVSGLIIYFSIAASILTGKLL
ncbi:magnesium transporter [Sphingobacterium rhinopitheci]|uniref:magnesium transporter n=1 Tax=Sphingobacterium rhinopitheci TaxID=2781960 RepID=UPI001F529229|nr:magnesium transporter [Sphingobacterium rhinopitheci]MCI0922247.1 magnesium transporter [Sphingobacterium rhinopitheci]